MLLCVLSCCLKRTKLCAIVYVCHYSNATCQKKARVYSWSICTVHVHHINASFCYQLLVFLLFLKEKNSSSRQKVLNAEKGHVTINSMPQLLPRVVINNAIALSDLLNLDEVLAAELIVAGEQLQSEFPMLSPGLIAVLLYYDRLRHLAICLRTLIQARRGVTWEVEGSLNNDLVSLVMDFTDELYHKKLIPNILDLVRRLENVTDLGPFSRKDPQHCSEVFGLINEIRGILCDCLFYWSCQMPFSKEVTLEILQLLQKVEHSGLTYVELSLFMTLLASFSVSESHTHLPSNYPIVADSTHLPALHKHIRECDWPNKPLEAAVKFAWAVLLRECSLVDTLASTFL